MRVRVSFENMEALKRAYDPAMLDKAAGVTIKQLQTKAATAVSREVRQKYNIQAAAIKSALKQSKVTYQDGMPTGYLIYLSKRISLNYFRTPSRPRIKTKRGIRYGAKTKLYKGQSPKIQKGGFFGTGLNSGSPQIFYRPQPWQPYLRSQGLGPNKLWKMTAPSISQMIGGGAPLAALDRLFQEELNSTFEHNLDHFMQKQMGLR